MRHGALDIDILRQVNEEGFELGITLLVSGWWITGFLTPDKFFADWVDEVQGRAAMDVEGFRIPSGEVPKPTKEQLEAARREWPTSDADEVGADEKSGDERDSFLLHLRNAKCWHPGITMTFDRPYFCIDSAAVAAWTLGTTKFDFFTDSASRRG